MSYAYISGLAQHEGEIRVSKGRAIGGQAVGIIVIDVWYPMVPGNIANATTFKFPVLFKILRGVSGEQIMNGDPALLDPIIQGARELTQQGARAIVGACGSFAYYQKAVAATLEVPAFMSVMLQVPLILQSLRPNQKLGILAASASALTPRVFEQCNITDTSRLAITEARDLQEFQVMGSCTGGFNSHRLEQEVVTHVKRFVIDHPEVGAILLQCSDLPPYAWAIQNAVQLPVFDMTTLINWVYQAVVREPFSGHL
jgi:aspartate/glutamate racemase